MATNRQGQLAATLATPISHYRTWGLTVGCSGCREKKELRIEPHIQDGKGGDPVSRFILRLKCATCGKAPDYTKLHSRAAPTREIVLIGPGAY